MVQMEFSCNGIRFDVIREPGTISYAYRINKNCSWPLQEKGELVGWYASRDQAAAAARRVIRAETNTLL